MGSSQSHPNTTPSDPSDQTPSFPPTSRPRPSRNGSTSRLGSLRRLSTLGSIGRRNSDHNGKRVRQGSSSTSASPLDQDRPERSEVKKQKRERSRSQSRSICPQQSPPPASSHIAESNAIDASILPAAATTQIPQQLVGVLEPTPYSQPVAEPSLTPLHPALSIPLPLSPPLSPSLLSPSSDPLAEERLQSLSTIREALGPSWPNDIAAPAPAVERLLHRFRRSSSFPPPPTSPSSASQSPHQRTMSDRLTALLGLATPAESSVVETPPQSAPSTSAPSAEPTIEQLTQRLEQAREELANTSRQLDEARERVEAARRRPTGAVLVIQGLAQTQTQESSDGADSPTSEESNTSTSDTSGPFRRRRASESNARHAASATDPPASGSHNGSSLETQARMIGGLLTVAAAATATTLLSPGQPAPSASRSTAASALESIMNRLRPQRTRAHTVESALSSYLRSALRENRPPDGSQPQADSEGSTGEAAVHMSSEFQRFLETLQGDLVGAVRAFAGPIDAEAGDAESFVTATEGSTTPNVSAPTETVPNLDRGQNADLTENSASIPAFHYQAGQNLPGSRSSPEVTGGTEGVPRRLNFFRAHLFPPVSSSSIPTPDTPAPEDDPEALVPCIFIGVRSIRHNPAMTTEDLVGHPSFPFVDGQVPETTSTDDPTAASGTNDSQTPASPTIAPASPSSGRRSLRDRVMERLTHASSTSARTEPTPQGPLNTYLVYVIGGNYPRTHPVLSIPNLITGGPLTDEEMALVSELMGPAKPPTVGKDEIEKSGLRIAKGDEMKTLNEKSELLDSCADRCLICLSDYEPEEDCRILNCRHGYHKECVDQWLSVGRNSCPACRSEAVDTKAAATTTAEAPSAENTTPIESATAEASNFGPVDPSSSADVD